MNERRIVYSLRHKIFIKHFNSYFVIIYSTGFTGKMLFLFASTDAMIARIALVASTGPRLQFIVHDAPSIL